MEHNWTKIDNWNLSAEADGASLMIVANELGERYLLAARRRHAALPATWGEAVQLRADDTRETLEADAGCNTPMPVWVYALSGYDTARPVMHNWCDNLVHNIANAAR
jgi:hypothetical protein